jgi:phosphatidate cytidylyltransferase
MIAALTALLWWDHHLGATGSVPVGLPLAALTAVLVAVGYIEFSRLADAAGLPTLRATGIVASVALALTPVWGQWLDGGTTASTVLLVLAATVAACFAMQMATHRIHPAIRRIAGTLMGVLYLGGLTAALLLIRVDFGIPALVLVLAAVKGTDIGAYFTGSMIGRHKLIPWLSPGKTWEGLAGGVAAAAIVAMALNAAMAIGLAVGAAALTGVALGLIGQFGDLCESLLKRDAGLKDSASLIPEFGGVLDLVDSPLVAAPAGYALLTVLL